MNDFEREREKAEIKEERGRERGRDGERERWRERGREGGETERNIIVREKHQSVVYTHVLTGNGTYMLICALTWNRIQNP